MTETLWKTSVPSTAFLNGVKFSTMPGRKCLIEYSYEGDNSINFEQLIFSGVESFNCTYYKACSLEMIEAYDKLVNIINSKWLSEVKCNLSINKVEFNNLKHLRIYFDDGPCYEFICKSFKVLNNQKDFD